MQITEISVPVLRRTLPVSRLTLYATWRINLWACALWQLHATDVAKWSVAVNHDPYYACVVWTGRSHSSSFRFLLLHNFRELTAGHASNHVLYRILLASIAEPRLYFCLCSSSFLSLWYCLAVRYEDCLLEHLSYVYLEVFRALYRWKSLLQTADGAHVDVSTEACNCKFR